MRRASTSLAFLLLCGLGGPSRPVTIFLAGDSTMAAKLPERRPETGWGEALGQFFEPGAVEIENHARNGRSTRTFIEEGLWREIVDRLRPGDYVFIQFGHNDESNEKTDRYAPPDVYRRNLAQFVDDVRTRQANPVLLTPVARRKFDADGQLVDTHGEYPGVVRALAAETHVPLIDMLRRSADVLARYGAEPSRGLFLQLAPGANPNYPAGIEDNTHFSPAGAEAMAREVVAGIREASLGLARFLRSDGRPRNPTSRGSASASD